MTEKNHRVDDKCDEYVFFFQKFLNFIFFNVYFPVGKRKRKMYCLLECKCLYRKSWKSFPRKRDYFTQFLCLSFRSGKKKANFANL